MSSPRRVEELWRAQRALEQRMARHYAAARDPDQLIEALEAIRPLLEQAQPGQPRAGDDR